MSRRSAIALIVVGAAVGAWFGFGYLTDDSRCGGIVENVGACRINHQWIPFLGAVLAGVIAAFLLFGLGEWLWLRYGAGAGSGSVSGQVGVALERGLHDMELDGAELGLTRSSGGESERERRIGERGRPVPRPRRSRVV